MVAAAAEERRRRRGPVAGAVAAVAAVAAAVAAVSPRPHPGVPTLWGWRVGVGAFFALGGRAQYCVTL